MVELLEMTDRWASVEDCKFYLYQPNDIPRLFHGSGAKTRFLGGGNRSSKTYSHIIDYACQFAGRAPQTLQGLIPIHRLDQNRQLRFCMEDYPNSFTKVVWPYIKTLIPTDTIADVVKDSGRIRAITNRKGGFLEFMYYDQEVSKHQGTKRHSIGYDEEPPESIRDEGLMRLVDTDGEESFSLTPTTGLRYLYDKVIERRGREVQKQVDLTYDSNGKLTDAILGGVTDNMVPGGDPDVHVFYADIFDNKAINKKAAIRILNNFPKEERMMRSRGYHMFRFGLVYGMFSDNIHLIDPFEEWRNDSDYALFLALDPHPRVPHAILFMAVHRNGMRYIVDELFIDPNAEGLAEAIKIKCHPKAPEAIIIDPSAFSPDPISRSCLAWALIDALEANGIDSPLVRGSKDVTNGIIATKKALTPAYSEIAEKDLPSILITRNCVEFRREITHWTWQEWSKDTKNEKGDKQKPVDKDDHFMENLRRLVMFDPQFKEPQRMIIDRSKSKEKPPSRFYEAGRSATTGY